MRDATSSLSAMIQDSDLRVCTMGYGKAVPKKFRLSPDGWFQVCTSYGFGKVWT